MGIPIGSRFRCNIPVEFKNKQISVVHRLYVERLMVAHSKLTSWMCVCVACMTPFPWPRHVFFSGIFNRLSGKVEWTSTRFCFYAKWTLPAHYRGWNDLLFLLFVFSFDHIDRLRNAFTLFLS